MSMRELTDGEVETCRQKATARVADFVRKLPADLPEDERMKKLTGFFNLKAGCTDQLVENFDPALFVERGNDLKTPYELTLLMRGAVEGVETLKAICSEMAQSPLAYVNGTSVVFDECAGQSKIYAERLETARKVYETNGAGAHPKGFVASAMAKLSARVCQALTIFAVVPDFLGV